MIMHMQLDAEFHAFELLTKLAAILMPNERQYTLEQIEALHQYAAIIARDLTNGDYVFNEKRHKDKKPTLVKK